MKKNLLTLTLALLMAFTLVPVSVGAAAVNESDNRIITLKNDGVAITEKSFDSYFKGTALDAVKALLAEGKVYVNGIRVPVDENSVSAYEVNGLSSLYKTNTGWGYNVHKTTSSNNLSFADARLGFFQTITTVRGHVVKLYRKDVTGAVEKIDADSIETVRIAYMDTHGGSTEIDRGKFALETNRVRPDVNKIIFPATNVDKTLAIGDVAFYWCDATGWHLKRAVPVVGTLAKNKDGMFVIGGTDTRIESNVSRYNLHDANRPTQFYTAYTRLGLTNLAVTTWCTDTGHPIGFTYGSGAKAALALAIGNAKAAKAGVVVSTNGEDVAAGTKWAPKEAIDAFDTAINSAQKVYNSNLSASLDYDSAIYTLGNELGTSGDKPSGFIGAQGKGTK